MDNGQVGAVIRRIRKGTGMTLGGLSGATGLSQSFISQFERGQTQASIASLRLLTDALGMNLHDVFDLSSGSFTAVVRGPERPRLPFGDRAMKTIVSSRGLSRFEIFEVEFEVGGSTGPDRYAHGEHEELVLITTGSVGVEVGTDRHLLHAGDSITFHSDVPHRVENVGPMIARVLWIVSPPGYSGATRTDPRPVA
jgi:transcriptional regulator with XRE-family HTH domain